MWNITFNPEAMDVEITPARNPQAHYNITTYVTPPACLNCLTLSVNSFDTVSRVMDIDVTLRNPFVISGHDVRGILFTNTAGHLILNPDAWTGLWDVPGGQDINPFKAFAKTEPSRTFAGMAVHTENYLVHIPVPPQFISITYAADASWPGNCREPYDMYNFSQEEITDTTGDSGIIQLRVDDWQTDVDAVKLYAPDIAGAIYIELYPIPGDVWEVELFNSQGAAAGEYTAQVKATSSNSGTQALYNYFTITITEDTPAAGWARSWGNTSDEKGVGVTTDSSGNIYVTGNFYGSVDFDPGPGIDEHASVGSYDIFISKFSPDGTFQWARTWGSVGVDRGESVITDTNSDVYVTGSFTDTIDFGTGGLSSNGSYDVFVVKLNSSGSTLWARSFGGTNSDFAYDITANSSGSTWLTGSFRLTVDFNPDPVGVEEYTAVDDDDVFLTHFDKSGNHEWARTWGGTDEQQGEGVALDGLGNICVTGYFRDSVDFDPGTGTDIHSPPDVSANAFLSKFNSSGDHLSVVAIGSANSDESYGVAIDSTNNVCFAGYFQHTIDFDPFGTIDEHASVGEGDIFLSKYEPSGDYLWTRTWGGVFVDKAWAVAIDGSDNIFVTGEFMVSVDFNPGTGTDEHTSNGVSDAFLSKFPPDGTW